MTPWACQNLSISSELGCMKTSLSSIPTKRIARSLLLILAATAACTFFSACVGHQARVENRQERRSDRQERRQGESQPTPIPKISNRVFLTPWAVCFRLSRRKGHPRATWRKVSSDRGSMNSVFLVIAVKTGLPAFKNTNPIGIMNTFIRFDRASDTVNESNLISHCLAFEFE